MSEPGQQPEENPITRRESVLAIGGHDASGGAGIHADIETIAALGVHPLSLVTAMTVQNTLAMSTFESVDPGLILRQFDALNTDIEINVIKIGMIGSLEALAAIMTIIDALPAVPVVYDPVLAAGGGGEASNEALIDAVVEGLLPRCYLSTPNSIEARRLVGVDDLGAAAKSLLHTGLQNLLVTGSHEAGAEVVHRWWSANMYQHSWTWQRLAGEYHGSGCTLASAIAALLARGTPLKMALGLAQAFTYSALQQGYRVGYGQLIPGRIGGNKE